MPRNRRLEPPSQAQARRRVQLERTLLRYLELQIAQLERASVADADANRRSEVRSTVGQLVTWLLLLVIYALILGLTSRAFVIAALLNPSEFGHNLAAVGAYAGQSAAVVPEAFRGLAISAISAGALLVFRSASFSIKSDLGGALFVGVAILSL